MAAQLFYSMHNCFEWALANYHDDEKCLVCRLPYPNNSKQLLSGHCLNTIPEQINGGSPLVLGIENSNDVKIVCEIFFNDTPLITEWRLVSEDDTFRVC